MARIAILSDIHGNLRAFQAVLREVATSGVKLLAVAGDIIGYGAKPRECLEYIVVHEMVHLREPTHNAGFLALMDRFMPKWQSHREALNKLPVRHESWDY